MYYRLNAPWAFRGWKGHPFALQAQMGEERLGDPLLLDKKPFLELLSCNGEEDVDLASMSGVGQRILQELLVNGLVESSPRPLPPLSAFQHYHLYPSAVISSVHWSITGKCNFQCRHCLASAPGANPPQLPLEDCMRIIDGMAECGVRHVDLTGGEPLVRKDFDQIVQALSDHGIAIGIIFTNASLIREETLDLLQAAGQRPCIQLSFDGLGHHDWLRGVPGAEKMADAAFRQLARRGFKAMAAMCIHRENSSSLRATANYLAGLGVSKLRVCAPLSLGLWKGCEEEYALSDNELWEVYRAYIPHYFEDGMPISIDLDGYFSGKKGKTEYEVHYAKAAMSPAQTAALPYCENVRQNVYISPEGLLMPCMGFSGTPLKDRFPNVLDHPLRELTLDSFWRDVVETRVGDLMAKEPECASCDKIGVCRGGCMLADITEDGDYLVRDSRCCYFHKHVGLEKVCREVETAAARLWPQAAAKTYISQNAGNEKGEKRKCQTK